MAWISEVTIQAVRSIDSIVDIIGTYVTLKRRGRNYIGNCPFHNEKTPSFTVSPEKKIFHCFGCHESGDLIAFIQKIDNLSFHESVEKIAEMAGISIEYDRTKALSQPVLADDIKRQIVHALNKIQLFFHHELKRHATAMEYLRHRGLSSNTLETFQIGYAPPQFNVSKWSASENIALTVIKKTGILAQQSANADQFRFKNRIMFPIIDPLNRTIGFGGRVFELNQGGAKYINSEESPLFSKRNILYGLNQAKAAIKHMNCVIVVEGYMDVLMCYQFGIQNVVAIMGTALTQTQISLISRYTKTILLCLDNDRAGQDAIERSCTLLIESACIAKIISLDAKDPADFLMAHGKDVFLDRVNGSVPILEFIINRAYQKWDPSAIEHAPAIISFLSPFLRAEKEVIIRNHFIQKVANTLTIEPEMILVKIENSNYNIQRNFSINRNTDKSKRHKSEEFLIAFSAINLSHRDFIFDHISPSDFTVEHLSYIAVKLKNTTTVNYEFINTLDNADAKRKLTELILKVDALNLSHPSEKEISDYINVITQTGTLSRIKALKTLIETHERKGNEDQVNLLLTELQALKQNAPDIKQDNNAT